jgi:hypothetical protein
LNSDSQAEINKCIELALSCVETYVAYKPTVKHIASFLSKLGQRGNYAAYNYIKPTVGGYNEQKLYRNLQYKIGHDESSDGLGHIKVDHSLREYRYDELVRATDNFSSDREIGRGAFAVVYKVLILSHLCKIRWLHL